MKKYTRTEQIQYWESRKALALGAYGDGQFGPNSDSKLKIQLLRDIYKCEKKLAYLKSDKYQDWDSDLQNQLERKKA